jgi:hypothetical protein
MNVKVGLVWVVGRQPGSFSFILRRARRCSGARIKHGPRDHRRLRVSAPDAIDAARADDFRRVAMVLIGFRNSPEQVSASNKMAWRWFGLVKT